MITKNDYKIDLCKNKYLKQALYNMPSNVYVIQLHGIVGIRYWNNILTVPIIIYLCIKFYAVVVVIGLIIYF